MHEVLVVPRIATWIYLPAKSYLLGLEDCASEADIVGRVYDALLEHELAHSDIYRGHGLTWDGGSFSSTVLDGTWAAEAAAHPADQAFFKQALYAAACHESFIPQLAARNQELDRNQQVSAVLAQLSAECRGRD